MVVAINQRGRPVVLFGTTLPDKLEGSPYRRYLTTIHYLALVCSKNPPMTLLDIAGLAIDQTAEKIVQWLFDIHG